MAKNFDPGKIKAVVLDLDGTTLLPDTTMGERTAACLRRLIAKGMFVQFATGRPGEATVRYCEQSGASGPMVLFNGAEVMDMPKGEIIDSDFLENDVADFGIDLARSMGVHFQMYLPQAAGVEGGGGKWEPLVIEKQTEEADIYFKHTGIKPAVTDLKKALARSPGCVKAMFLADAALHEEIKSKMRARFGSRINLIRSSPLFLEVLKAGVSKGQALKTVMGRLGLEARQVMAFGDEENDLEMFKTAGFCAAPSSAPARIQKEADFIFGPSACEGLAAYLEATFL